MMEDIVRIDIDKELFALIASLESSIEACDALNSGSFETILRKASMIRSVSSSLAIEGNSMRPLEMIDLIDGEDVFGPFDEILEVKNAVVAYGRLHGWRTWSVDDFLEAFDVLMFGLVEKPGFREVGVRVFENDRLIYKAPDHSEVPSMIERLFDWCSGSNLPEPILGAVAHFYIESIHPFDDGNGRMGRMWNTKVMAESNPAFGMIPMETYIRRRQDEYYSILERGQHEDGFDCTRFVKFCLDCSIQAFDDLSHIRDERMMELLESMDDGPMSLKDIMTRMGYGSRDKFMKNYIRPALDFGLIYRTQDDPNNRYQRYRRVFRASGPALDHQMPGDQEERRRPDDEDRQRGPRECIPEDRCPDAGRRVRQRKKAYRGLYRPAHPVQREYGPAQEGHRQDHQAVE